MMEEKLGSERNESKNSDIITHYKLAIKKPRKTRIQICKFVRNYMKDPEHSNNLPISQEHCKFRALFSYYSILSLSWIQASTDAI